jgi:hypothetical protein
MKTIFGKERKSMRIYEMKSANKTHPQNSDQKNEPH